MLVPLEYQLGFVIIVEVAYIAIMGRVTSLVFGCGKLEIVVEGQSWDPLSFGQVVHCSYTIDYTMASFYNYNFNLLFLSVWEFVDKSMYLPTSG